MRAPIIIDQDFVSLLKQLLPRGRAWPRDPETVIDALMDGLAPANTRIAARGRQLLDEAMPTTTFELLPQWEESLGLPDPCQGEAPTVVLRRNQVVARFTNSGGQKVAYYIAFALLLGYTITITQFAPSRFGRFFGMPFGGTAWAHTWQINAPAFTVAPLTFGSGFGEAFASWGNDVLRCELERIKPSHTILLFNYVS